MERNVGFHRNACSLDQHLHIEMAFSILFGYLNSLKA